LSLTFPAPQSDLTYTVEASTDLINWSATGVTTQTNGTQMTASYTTARRRRRLPAHRGRARAVSIIIISRQGAKILKDQTI